MINGFISEEELLGGVQKKYRFDNDFGASVVKHQYSYGGKEDLWELGVLLWDGSESHLCYSTSITNDVIGFLSDEEVEHLLEKIQALTKGENRE